MHYNKQGVLEKRRSLRNVFEHANSGCIPFFSTQHSESLLDLLDLNV